MFICANHFVAVLQAVTGVTARHNDNNGELLVTWQAVSGKITGYSVR